MTMLLHEATAPATALEYFRRLHALYEKHRPMLLSMEKEMAEPERRREDGCLVSWDSHDEILLMLRDGRELDDWWIQRGGLVHGQR